MNDSAPLFARTISHTVFSSRGSFLFPYKLKNDAAAQPSGVFQPAPSHRSLERCRGELPYLESIISLPQLTSQCGIPTSIKAEKRCCFTFAANCAHFLPAIYEWPRAKAPDT
jgi:hypothetical protein